MKIKTQISVWMLIIVSGILLFSGCEYDAPTTIWDENSPLGAIPEISSIDPANVAVGGIDEIVINGSNFSPVLDSNIVYINGTKAILKESTTNRIVFYRPAVAGDSIDIKVVVRDANGVAYQHLYEFETTNEVWGDFTTEKNVFAVAADKDDNCYVMVRKNVFKIDPSGAQSLWAEIGLKTCTDMKIGPDGALYFADDDKDLYRAAEGQDESTWEKFPDKISVFDFDENLNIFAARRSDLMVMNYNTKAAQTLSGYEDYYIDYLRVYNGELYTLTTYQGDDESESKYTIWKHTIDPSGTLSDKQAVIAWSSDMGIFSKMQPSGFTFSESGLMFISVLKGVTSITYPVVVVDPADKSVRPLYNDPSILLKTADQLVWGGGRYLFLNRGRTFSGRITDVTDENDALKVFRLAMNENGAPYYGRP